MAASFKSGIDGRGGGYTGSGRLERRGNRRRGNDNIVELEPRIAC